jgi:hypothetical protein
VDPGNPAHWEDLTFVPSLTAEHENTTINRDWRMMVNGRLLLRGGTLKGMPPSFNRVRNDGFDFKESGTSKFEQAVTDRVLYVVDVPGPNIEIELSEAESGLTRIVIAPAAPGQAVRLRLAGLHDPNMGGFVTGAELKDHCAFYSLLQPIPPPEKWLRPHHVPGTGPFGTTPGYFCPGDWF